MMMRRFQQGIRLVEEEAVGSVDDYRHTGELGYDPAQGSGRSACAHGQL